MRKVIPVCRAHAQSAMSYAAQSMKGRGMSEEQAWHVLAGYIAAVAYMAFGFAAIVFLDSENGMWAVLYAQCSAHIS